MNERTYTIPISNGLLDPKHCRTISDALWLFIYLVDKQTRRVDKNGYGKVSGGMPIRDKDIAGTLGCSSRTIIRWREILVRHGYITTRRTPYGCAYAIAKPKKWTQKSPVSAETDVTEMSPLSPRDMTQPVERYDTTCINKEDSTRDYSSSRSRTESAAAVSKEQVERELNAVWRYYLEASGSQELPSPSKGKMGAAIIRKLHEQGYPHPVITMTATIDMAKHLARKNPKKVGLFKWTSMFSKWDTAKSLWLECLENNPPEAAELPAEFSTAEIPVTPPTGVDHTAQ